MRDRAVVACLAHNQEVVGSSPTLATDAIEIAKHVPLAYNPVLPYHRFDIVGVLLTWKQILQDAGMWSKYDTYSYSFDERGKSYQNTYVAAHLYVMEDQIKEHRWITLNDVNTRVSIENALCLIKRGKRSVSVIEFV